MHRIVDVRRLDTVGVRPRSLHVPGDDCRARAISS